MSFIEGLLSFFACISNFLPQRRKKVLIKFFNTLKRDFLMEKIPSDLFFAARFFFLVNFLWCWSHCETTLDQKILCKSEMSITITFIQRTNNLGLSVFIPFPIMTSADERDASVSARKHFTFYLPKIRAALMSNPYNNNPMWILMRKFIFHFTVSFVYKNLARFFCFLIRFA